MADEATPATPVKTETSKTKGEKTFSLEFQIPEDMLEIFAKIGLEVVLKQRLQDISDTVKK